MRKVTNLIYDVGLHKGEDTNFYLRKGYDVVAFEADPVLVAHCKVRFRTETGRARLRIVEGAIAPASAGEEITLFRSSVSAWGTADEK